MEHENAKSNLIWAKDIEPKDVEWLWYPYIPAGKITVVQGDPGDGKSHFMLAIASILSKGEAFPFTDEQREPVNVIYQTSEDDVDDTLVPRFIRAEGDTEHLAFINEKDNLLTLSDSEKIRAAIEESNAKLIVFDPLTSYIGGDISMNSANEVRSRFNELIKIARETGCAVVIVCHMNKMSGGKGIYRTLGSIDIVGTARSCLAIGRSKEDPDERIMAVQKSNLAEQGASIRFSLAGGKVTWIDITELSADELLGSFSFSDSKKGTKIEAAKVKLEEMLAGGAKPQQEIITELKEQGISKRTAENAKAELEVVSFKKGKRWYWKLP